MIQFSPEMPKKPNEGLHLSISFAREGWLRPGETIDTCVWSCQVHSGMDPNPQAMISGPATIDGPTVEQFVVGGVEGVVYLFLATATTLPARAAPMVGRALLRVATV